MTIGTVGPARNEPDRTQSLQEEAEQLLAAHRADDAVVPLRELSERRPDDARVWLRLAAALLAGDGGPGADVEARAAAERSVTLDPSSALGYRMLSEAALRLGDRDTALATMRAAVSAAPDSWVTHLDLAAALLERPGGGVEAWQLAKRAASIAPQRAEPHVLLGDLALRAGDVDRAAAGYADALDRAPGDLTVTRKLSELHQRLGDPAALPPPVDAPEPTLPGTAAPGAPRHAGPMDAEPSGATWPSIADAAGTTRPSGTDAAGTTWPSGANAAGTARPSRADASGTTWPSGADASGTTWPSDAGSSGAAWPSDAGSSGAAWPSDAGSSGAAWPSGPGQPGTAWPSGADSPGAADPTGAPGRSGPAETLAHRPARVLGNCLAVLSILAAAVAGMLLALAPDTATGWYRIVTGIAGVGLLLVAVLLLVGSAPGWRRLTGGRGGLVVSAILGGVAVLAGPISALADWVPGLLGAAALGVLGCLCGHLVARAAIRRDRTSTRPRHTR